MKNHTRFSKASGSELAKLCKLAQRGWKPGAGKVGDWLRSIRREKRRSGSSQTESAME